MGTIGVLEVEAGCTRGSLGGRSLFIEGTEARAMSRLRGRGWGQAGKQVGLDVVAWELGVESEALGCEEPAEAHPRLRVKVQGSSDWWQVLSFGRSVMSNS